MEDQVKLNEQNISREELAKKQEQVKTTERNADIVEVSQNNFKTRLRD